MVAGVMAQCMSMGIRGWAVSLGRSIGVPHLVS